jgi:hypothetical protein
MPAGKAQKAYDFQGIGLAEGTLFNGVPFL